MWNGPLPEDAPLAIYMPGRDLAALAEELRSNGVAADMPCVAISCAATPRQRANAATLADFGELVPGPARLLVLIGRAMLPMVETASGRVMQQIVQQAVASLSL